MSRIKHTSENWSEKELIKAIEKRPILFDKSLPEYRKASLTERAWSEVALHVRASRKLLQFHFNIESPLARKFFRNAKKYRASPYFPGQV